MKGKPEPDATTYATPQEEFWAGSFGTEYIGRNEGDELLASNLGFFAAALRQAGKISSCLELGANVGMNLKALRLLHPGITLRGVEINPEAARRLRELIGAEAVFEGSISDFPVTERYELVLTKTVLIHINEAKLPAIYDMLYEASRRYILVCEYYNTTPVAIRYRGHDDRLFKRDFAGELMDRHPDLRLLDYGFAYHRIPPHLNDDVTWFLMEKK
jgi:pseudaminic acid biosynthesis-associated methylase